jgi:hypothetical protein
VRRDAATSLLLAAGTVLVWWLVFPADWSAVPTAHASTFRSPVTATHWWGAGIGLTALAVVGGFVGGVRLAMLGVALPAFALYCVSTASAEVIGANLWIVGAILLAPVLAAGVACAAALGRLLRRRRSAGGGRPWPS